MKAYLLAFSDNAGTQVEIKEALNKMPAVSKWRYDMTNAFYIVSDASATELSDDLRRHIKPDGRFIIVEVGDNRNGWITPPSWYLLRHKEYKPK